MNFNKLVKKYLLINLLLFAPPAWSSEDFEQNFIENHVPSRQNTCITNTCKVVSLFSLWFAFNYGFEYLLQHTPANYQEFSNALTSIQIALNVVITSPFFLPLQSYLNKLVFSAGSKNFSNDLVPTKTKNDLEDIWWKRQKILTQNSQISIDRWSVMDNNCKAFFTMLSQMLLINKSNNKKPVDHLIAKALARRMYEHKNQYPDFPPDMHVTTMSYGWLKQIIGDFDLCTESFKSLLQSEISKLDFESSQDEFYEKAISCWLKNDAE